MEDLGFILATYLITFGSVATMAAFIVRRGRRLAAQLPAEDKPWI
ncbi:unannotated protein [freshwater metagenome]|uniref:Unannotated protein n=1 Tax=freshwater metagenome TaxID=449393 RepID=A0A6J7CNS5_9ZZZZ